MEASSAGKGLHAAPARALENAQLAEMAPPLAPTAPAGHLGGTEPGVTEPRVAEPGVSEPGVTGQDVAEPDVAEREAACRRRDGVPARLPVELSAFEGYFPLPFLHAVAWRARQLGVGGDEALRCAGLVSAAEATERLGAHLGLDVVGCGDALDPLAAPDEEMAAWGRGALRTGVMGALDQKGRPRFTLAVEGRRARRLVRALRFDKGLRGRLRLVPRDLLQNHVMAHAGEAMAGAAAFGFRDAAPDKSAGALNAARLLLKLALLAGAALAAGCLLSPLVTLLLIQGGLSFIFLAWFALRLAGCRLEPESAALRPPLEDRQLPVYSILIPLYKEAESVPVLVKAMAALDYPPEKLDIKLVVEADDALTRAAIANATLPPFMEEVAVPAIGPRTKPKALNMALAFTRGSFVAIYDAEDQPEPDQLRRALAAFRDGGPDVACVQARLCIDNGAESWISGHFAAEYAGQFDVLLPVLSALGLPILLGGTSNHFRRDVLERLGGWDPFNVTEDADLGVRLARAGWRTLVIDSTTYEEAPLSISAWLGQRARWLKGWAQTLLVHGRHPRALVRDLGWRATFALLVLTAGPFASALLHPFCVAVLAWQAGQGVLGLPAGSLAEALVSALTYSTLAVGYGGTALAIGVGLARRGERLRQTLAWSIPFYWLLLSLAAWKALVELVRRPYHWQKTQHGLSVHRRVLRGGKPQK